MSPAALDWSASIKRAVDPTNVFGIGNQCVDPHVAESPHATGTRA